jgi:hypothetical protein
MIILETHDYDRSISYGPLLIRVWNEPSSGQWKAVLDGRATLWARKGGYAAVVVDLALTLRSFGYSDSLADYIVVDNFRRPLDSLTGKLLTK